MLGDRFRAEASEPLTNSFSKMGIMSCMTQTTGGVHDAGNQAPPSPRWIYYYDGNYSLCSVTVQVLTRFDPIRQVQWIAFQSLEEPPQGLSWEDLDRAAYLDTRRGVYHEGFYSFRMLSLRLFPLVLFAPILWFPGTSLIGGHCTAG